MIVEIQADSYEPLLESLRRIAVIKDSPKVEKTEGDKLIRVKITFQQDSHSRR